MFWRRNKRKNKATTSNSEFCDPRLLNEEEYSILCEIHNVFFNATSLSCENYQYFCEMWDSVMKDTFHGSITYVPFETKCSYLSSLYWGYLSMLLPDKDESYIYEGLFTTIANTVMAIANLTLDSLYIQAASLVRFLYEQCALLLAVTIDPEKRDMYVKLMATGDERKNWHKHFSFAMIEKTIDDYFNKNCPDLLEPLREIAEWRKEIYRVYSSLNHGGFIHMMQELLDDSGEETGRITFNLWGLQKTHNKNIIHNMNGILMYTSLLFIRLLEDTTIDIGIEHMVLDKDKITWGLVNHLGFAASGSYILNISKAE